MTMNDDAEIVIREVVELALKREERLFTELQEVWTDGSKRPDKVLIVFTDGERVVTRIRWID
jgi:hypothetical protein